MGVFVSLFICVHESCINNEHLFMWVESDHRKK